MDTLIGTIIVGILPFGVAFLPNGTKAYLANQLGFNISIIDVSTDMVIGIITMTEPVVVAITPDGTEVYVTNLDPNNVSVVDSPSEKLMNKIFDFALF